MSEAASAGNYLTFTLDGELYAVRVSRVREVLGYSRITRLPKAAQYLKGIINLRGSSVPVVDLRMKFGLAGRAEGEASSVVVMELPSAEGGLVVGALADEVHEVLEIAGSSIEPAPRFGTRLAAAFIEGVARRDEDFIILLDVERIFGEDEAGELAGAAQAEAAPV
ncbi:MAG TPA: chemotaxis protein CheW [Spirochaetales bacterium]|nr:chemotaxis protein CheW [Spirochaetales bacterium]HRY55749.1 chemotaxis protein CheW [Spirochaetia bacterium]HRZ65153.1 chemotaxis protein CheW [Spirochaetia bacterium]